MTNDDLRIKRDAAMTAYLALGGSRTEAGLQAWHEALKARNDLVDRGVICDFCEADIVDGRCSKCGEKALACSA